jgi:uncharacterized membrane protein YqhA
MHADDESSLMLSLVWMVVVMVMVVEWENFVCKFLEYSHTLREWLLKLFKFLK